MDPAYARRLFAVANAFKQGDLAIGGTADDQLRDAARRDLLAVTLRGIRRTSFVDDGVTAFIERGRDRSLDADLDSSIRVIDRLMARLDHYEFSRPLTFEVGAACCPTHGADADSLRRAAESRPVRTRGDRSNAQ